MPAKRDKKERILETMLDLVVERGFHNAPMSLLAKRSGASPGVIYHYFPSKEDLIRALYLRLKSAKRQVFLEGYSRQTSPQQAFTNVWANAYHFYRTQIRETRFLEWYENSPFGQEHTITDSPEQEAARTHFLKAFRAKKAGGVLKNLPPEAIYELSFGLAARLAKKEETIRPGMLKKIADAAWSALAAD